MSHRTQVWVWKLYQEPSCYIIGQDESTGQTQSQLWNLNFRDVRFMITQNLFGRPCKAPVYDVRINYELPVFNFCNHYSSLFYLWDLDFIWTIYDIGLSYDI